MNNFNNVKIKKPQKIINETADIYLNSKSKNRNTGNTSMNVAPPSRKNEHEAGIKNINRKSIDVSISQPTKNIITTIYQTNQPIKPYYKRVNHNFRKQMGLKRYDEEEDKDKDNSRSNNKSPYMRDLPGRNSALNGSTHKIKSGQLMKQASPYQLYKQPRSSLSQHYDPTIELSLHKRRVSLLGDDKNTLLEESKENYKHGNYKKCIDILKKITRIHKTTIQAHYLLGMSLINNNEFNEGIQQLLQTLEINPSYKKSLYLVIALAYKRSQQYESAIQILSKGLILYPDYYDCLVYRGKLNLKLEKFQEALIDFHTAIHTNPEKGFAYVGKGTCQKQLGEKLQAIKTFTQGLQSDMCHICYEKRGIIYYEENKLDLALRDLQQCCKVVGYHSSTVNYYKGMIYYRNNKLVQAVLCFEQSLKCDNHHENVTLAVQMMIKIKIQEKDFYEAYHILNRADNVDVQRDVINQWRLFLEASLFLMKKKYKEGIDTYNSLLTLPLYKHPNINAKTNQRYIFLKPLIHLYKAFGELCENKPENAQKQYQINQEISNQIGIPHQNLSKNYNKLIMKAYKEFPENSLCFIEEAIKLIPTKPEPYLYLAFDKVHNKLDKQTNSVEKTALLNEIIEDLTVGISHLPQLSNNHISTFYFFRAILYLYKNDFNKAVGDVDKAIEKSEDNIPKYFYLRGLIFAIFGNFSQAVQDLSVAINLDQKYAKPYLERAKCLQIQGNSNQAFLDLQKYITLAPDDQQIHKYAGFLLFQNCAYEDCLSAFNHGADLACDYDLILTKAKCHFLLGEYEVALPLFKKYTDQTYSTEYQSDIDVIQICRNIKKESTNEELSKHISKINEILSEKNDEECKIFKFRDMNQIKGSIYLLMGQYEAAIKSFNKTLQLFIIQKNKELEKHFVEDSQEFEDQWSEVEIKFNLSLCYLCTQDYEKARKMLAEFEKCSEKGKNWSVFIQIIDDLISNNVGLKKGATLELDTFEQNHRISKFWPQLELPNLGIHLSLAFSYPFVEPPELMPQFNEELFLDFHIAKSENKPEAPWINRCDKGLIFTPNVQVYQNLQLSMTTTKKNEESEKNKPISEMDQSINMSNSDFQIETAQLKKKFKLDSLVEMRLNKLMNK